MLFLLTLITNLSSKIMAKGQRVKIPKIQETKSLDQIIQSFESGTFLDESLTVECKSSYGIKTIKRTCQQKILLMLCSEKFRA